MRRERRQFAEETERRGEREAVTHPGGLLHQWCMEAGAPTAPGLGAEPHHEDEHHSQ